MKKLNLEMLRLSTEEVLERSQMKKITGGYGGGGFNCYMLTCNISHGCYQSNCRCEVTGPNGSGYCVDRI